MLSLLLSVLRALHPRAGRARPPARTRPQPAAPSCARCGMRWHRASRSGSPAGARWSRPRDCSAPMRPSFSRSPR